jgi:hypothetical protein
MAFVLKNLLICLILFSSINSETLPTSNTCSYLKDTDEQPENENICLYSSMSNYESCCYVEYNMNNQVSKYCMTLTENITDQYQYSNITIKNSFDNNGVITKISCPGLFLTRDYINNCGLVGVLPPIDRENCSGISIPESNCCMIELKDGNKMCRRVKDLPDDEDDISDDVKNDIKRLLGSDASINKVYCSEHFVHLATSILVICLLTVIL